LRARRCGAQFRASEPRSAKARKSWRYYEQHTQRESSRRCYLIRNKSRVEQGQRLQPLCMQMHARRRRRCHHPLHFSARRYIVRAGRLVRSAHTLYFYSSFLGRRGDVHLSEQVNHANAPAIYSAARFSRADFAIAEMSGIESRAICVCASYQGCEQTHSPRRVTFCRSTARL
jgi:hypothetical protein